ISKMELTSDPFVNYGSARTCVNHKGKVPQVRYGTFHYDQKAIAELEWDVCPIGFRRRHRSKERQRNCQNTADRPHRPPVARLFEDLGSNWPLKKSRLSAELLGKIRFGYKKGEKAVLVAARDCMQWRVHLPGTEV